MPDVLVLIALIPVALLAPVILDPVVLPVPVAILVPVVFDPVALQVLEIWRINHHVESLYCGTICTCALHYCAVVVGLNQPGSLLPASRSQAGRGPRLRHSRTSNSCSLFRT